MRAGRRTTRVQPLGSSVLERQLAGRGRLPSTGWRDPEPRARPGRHAELLRVCGAQRRQSVPALGRAGPFAPAAEVHVAPARARLQPTNLAQLVPVRPAQPEVG
ncbi:hypothetical protein DIE18_03615 [Burkholderia sp. Bp9125]|nr:hypothetical protein DIE18_03615 [Burkholderia sp. Bp9125]